MLGLSGRRRRRDRIQPWRSQVANVGSDSAIRSLEPRGSPPIDLLRRIPKTILRTGTLRIRFGLISIPCGWRILTSNSIKRRSGGLIGARSNAGRAYLSYVSRPFDTRPEVASGKQYDHCPRTPFRGSDPLQRFNPAQSPSSAIRSDMVSGHTSTCHY